MRIRFLPPHEIGRDVLLPDPERDAKRAALKREIEAERRRLVRSIGLVAFFDTVIDNIDELAKREEIEERRRKLAIVPDVDDEQN